MKTRIVSLQTLACIAMLSCLPAAAGTVTANFTSATTVPVTAASYTATGNTVNISLGFAPPAGTSLTVVKNTGSNFISGVFSNLAQGQSVQLTYGGVIYAFVANYYGGTGNDLVLQWANNRLLAWGDNGYGELGNHTNDSSNIALPVDMSGALAGKTILSIATGGYHCLALCSDGTMVTWGQDDPTQLGTGNIAPVPVDSSGVLAGKTVIAIAAGGSHNLALCMDGTLAAWGDGSFGSLGNNSAVGGEAPVLVDRTGVLAGKTIVAISAWGFSSYALCADGTLAAWGYNASGQLGNNSTTNSYVPVLVDRSGVLSGKTITAISGSFVLCSDGTLATWGAGASGQLGNGSSANSSVPVLVTRTGVLSGKTVVAIASGGSHRLALCSNGTLVSWGDNVNGQLGNSTPSLSNVPVLVDQTGVLSGKTIMAISGGDSDSFAVCTDGSLASWGANSYGELGNNSLTDAYAAAWVTRNGMGTAERFVIACGGPQSSLSLVAMPPSPATATLAATAIRDTGATLNGNVNANGATTNVTFEYGLTSSYGNTIVASPASVTGTSTTAASATPGDLLSGTLYHYRIVATHPAGGNSCGADMTLTTSAQASLTSITPDSGTLYPAFDTRVTSYVISVPFGASSMALTAVSADPAAALTVNGATVASGAACAPVSLAVGNNVIAIAVSAPGGGNIKTYTLTVTRLPQVFAFGSASDAAVTVSDFVAAGQSVTFALNYAPTPGSNLTVVNNTGGNFISGTFANLAQGQAFGLTYGGVTYTFVANYYGGSGNDLVLQWANTRLLGWGDNTNYQLGVLTMTATNGVAVAVDMSGVLAGKTVTALGAGYSHTLALCSDGTLVGWGSNVYGQLTDSVDATCEVPAAMDQSGALAGKTVIAIAAGDYHNLALCSDGTLVAWGHNSAGQLGINSYTDSSVPVTVDRTGVLAGKTVTAISAGTSYSMALCADGTLAAWGTNSSGQLGNGSRTTSIVPVAVNTTGVLAGKRIIAIAAGYNHSMALCADGSIAAWGANNYGQLGNNYTQGSSLPVWVNPTGALAGKTATAIALGERHSICLCADGSVAAWGFNFYGQLGNNATTDSSVPVLVDQSGALAGKVATVIACGRNHSVAICADGTVAVWGDNSQCQLATPSTQPFYSSVPLPVDTSKLRTGERFVAGAAGYIHNIGIVASLPLPMASTLAASGTLDTGVTLNGTVNAENSATTVFFQYGLTDSYGTTLAANPATVTGTTTTAASATLNGLLSGTTYHYRISATSVGGTVCGDDRTFTTSAYADLSDLESNHSGMFPIFSGNIRTYFVTVPYATDTIAVTATPANADSTLAVNGAPVGSGTQCDPIHLTSGENTISIEVTAADGINTQTYAVKVTRLPQSFTFNSATGVPLDVSGFVAAGNVASFTLAYPPAPGTRLRVVNNSGIEPIHGKRPKFIPPAPVRLC